MSRRSFAIAVLFVVIAQPSIGAANPFEKPRDTRARKHLEDGNKRLELANYDEAIEEYKAGYLIEQKPIFLYNLALAYRKRGDYKAAISHYRNWLNRARPSKEIRAKIEEIIGEMDKELKQAARTKEPAHPEPRDRDQPFVSTDPQTRVDVQPWYADKIGWALAGGGVLVAGVGAGFMFNASALRSDAERELSMTKRTELRDRADTRQGWGIVLGITGVAAITGGIVKLWITGKKRGSSRTADVGFGPNWIAVEGRF